MRLDCQPGAVPHGAEGACMTHIARKSRTRQQLEELFKSVVPEGAELRDLDGSPAAFFNGHLFARIRRDVFVVRLGEGERKRLLAVPGATVFEVIKGRPMVEYVVLPDAVVDDTRALGQWFSRGHAYVATLETQTTASTPRAPAVRSTPTIRMEKTKV